MDSAASLATVEATLPTSSGAAVSRLLDARIAALMSRFSELTPSGQKRFLDLLNLYLYASPTQRRQLRSRWQEAMVAPCGEDGTADAAPHARRA